MLKHINISITIHKNSMDEYLKVGKITQYSKRCLDSRYGITLTYI